MAICNKICLFYRKKLSKKAGFGKNRPFFGPMGTSRAKQRAFQANKANVEQKCHVISLFWLKMTIF
jgi:hypothetical protein